MYRNYIFDFYGTLVDIHTNEKKPMLWKKMAEVMSTYGADYTPKQLQNAYYEQCSLLEKQMIRKTGYEYPEIEIGEVFQLLLKKAEKHHPVQYSIQSYKAWAYDIGSIFRILSRDYVYPYEHTIETLQELKQRGAHLYLLSNAQRIFTMSEIEMSGVLPYFDAIYLSSDVHMKKPQKEFLALLLQEQKLKPKDTVMVGNEFASDIQVALYNHIDSIYLNTSKYSKKQRDQQMKQLKQNKTHQPKIIVDGDLQKVLEV